jgi:uncharacterized integral membrane protein
MRIVFWIIALPVIAIAMAFAVSNHDPVAISLWPLVYRLEAPLYVVVTSALFVGFLIGMLYGGINTLRARHRARHEARHASKLQADNEDLRRKLSLAESATYALPPANHQSTTLRRIAGDV